MDDFAALFSYAYRSTRVNGIRVPRFDGGGLLYELLGFGSETREFFWRSHGEMVCRIRFESESLDSCHDGVVFGLDEELLVAKAVRLDKCFKAAILVKQMRILHFF
jgi:hypothetical protein